MAQNTEKKTPVSPDWEKQQIVSVPAEILSTVLTQYAHSSGQNPYLVPDLGNTALAIAMALAVRGRFKDAAERLRDCAARIDAGTFFAPVASKVKK